MPSRSEAAALHDILFHIDLASRFCSKIAYESFRENLQVLYAVTRCLEIISEASRRLSDELKERHPTIEWRRIAAAGNIYRHQYEDVAAHYVWDTVERALPCLRAVVESELARGE